MAGESPLSLMRANRQTIPRHAAGPAPAAVSRRRRRRGPWRFVALVGVVVALALGWCGTWYYAATVSARTLAGWTRREAAAGRIYSCGTQGISGFPFSIEARCVEAGAALKSMQPPLAIAAREITFTAQVLRPTVLVGAVTGPLTVAAPGQPPNFVATWSQALITVRGVPPNPDALSIDIEHPHLNRGAAANATTLFSADDADLQASIVGGSATDHPVIDAVLHFSAATAPTVHPLLNEPLQGDAEVLMRGLNDLSPKPWADRFREMQAAGGSIEIKSLRLERADAVVVGSGTLTVNAHGRLDGVIRVAIAGLDNIVPLLGIDQLIGQGINQLTGANGSPAQGLSALDRLLPGLGGVVRDSANASVVEDLKKMGQPTEIDQKPATALPLRFVDGAVYFGMMRLGEVPALF